MGSADDVVTRRRDDGLCSPFTQSAAADDTLAVWPVGKLSDNVYKGRM